MKMAISTKYISADESGQHVMQSCNGRVKPDGTFSPHEKTNILLAGGFPGLSPDPSFFLSPTLQLNSDLVKAIDKDLFALANAELKRFQAIRYRNYRVEADPRVCVVSKDPKALDEFTDTYGGVLDIHALLLGSASSHYPLVIELSFEAATHGCRLLYRQRAPIKRENCTYCGKCGVICPENCISPQLKVDYSRCTFCKECENVCSDDAMDIYGVEEIALNIPAVILLGQTGVELPENSAFVYQEKQLPDFLKTIYTAEIQEVVCHNNSICQYSSRLDGGCARCVDSCPYGAVSKSESGIVVDHYACQECGNCIAVCPTGAMQNGHFDDAVLFEYLCDVKHFNKSDLVIGEEKQLHELWWRQDKQNSGEVFYLEYSALSSLSFFHLLLFFAFGYDRVTLLGGDKIKENNNVLRNVATANSIVESLYGHGFVSIIDVDEYIEQVWESPPSLLTIPLKLTSFENRRVALSQILQQLLSDSGKALTGEKVGHEFTSLSCNTSGCTQCLACLNECKIHALKADQKDLTLTYLAGLCVGCGVCVEVCPEKVLTMDSAPTVDEQFYQRRVLAKAEAVECKKCGKVFGTRKSLDRVMEILSAREAVDKDHFSYCSACRVIKLFEAEGV